MQSNCLKKYYLSLFLRLANCRAKTHANVGPTTAPVAAFSIAPPIINSTSSAFLEYMKLEVIAWHDQSGAKAVEQLSQDMLSAAIEKAKQEMADRKKLEYMLWEVRK